MQIVFSLPSGHQSNLLAEAALVFADGSLGGLMLKGFAIWKSKKGDGSITVTFPARAYTAGGKVQYYWLLRSADDSSDKATWILRDRILAAYRTWVEEEK